MPDDCPDERFYRALFDEGPLGLVSIDCVAGCRIIESNRRFAKMLAYHRAELRGRNPASLTHPADAPAELKHHQDLMAQRCKSYCLEKRFLDRDNRAIWARVTVIGIPDKSGRPFQALLVAEDISEEKTSESRLLAEEQVLRQLLQLQDSERRLVSCEIHDGLTQDMVGAQMMLQALSAGYERRSQNVPQELESALRFLQRATNEARRLMSELRPMILEEMGVVESIRALLDREQASGDVEFTFVSRVRFTRLPDLLEGTLFRIVQESVNNINRHSQASSAMIRLTQVDPQHVVVEIVDDGVGFDPAAVPSNRGGLEGIRERARLFGGFATIESQPEAGTHITVKLPFRSTGINAAAVRVTI